jgi:hypothetical protein
LNTELCNFIIEIFRNIGGHKPVSRLLSTSNDSSNLDLLFWLWKLPTTLVLGLTDMKSSDFVPVNCDLDYKNWYCFITRTVRNKISSNYTKLLWILSSDSCDLDLTMNQVLWAPGILQNDEKSIYKLVSILNESFDWSFRVAEQGQTDNF